MPRLPRPLRLALPGLLAATLCGVAEAGAVTGVCPDGSMFVVQRRASAPCANPRFVDDPAHVPPLRPELLPHPYTWQVDQEARNPNNPYQLLEAAEKIRRAREAEATDRGTESRPEVVSRPDGISQPDRTSRPDGISQPDGFSQPNGGVPTLALDEEELRDLVRLITLRQEAAPAGILVEDVRGRPTLRIQVAHSEAFERLVLGALGRGSDQERVLAFTASAPVESEFHPNFFVTQHGKTFRPDPLDTREVAYLVGEAGPIPEGALALGYFVIPAHFDLTEPLTLWWNDRSVDVTLVR